MMFDIKRVLQLCMIIGIAACGRPSEHDIDKDEIEGQAVEPLCYSDSFLLKCYRGGFADGVFEGYGVLELYEGSSRVSVFRGDFEKGKPTKGVLTLNSGRVYEGRWISRDMFCFAGDCLKPLWDGVGHGSIVWVDGTHYSSIWGFHDVYVGQFRFGKPDGSGKQYNSEGKLIREGKWTDGR